jgi:ribosomal protein S18 acetylase RimI-like enzyme
MTSAPVGNEYPVEIEEMTMADHDDVLSLLRASPGAVIRGADSREGTERYLVRNPKLSFVARRGTRLVGCVMCGHDGRRGYLQHLAVDQTYQRRGVGTALVRRCLMELRRLGIDKTHIDVFIANAAAHQYWTNRRWTRRDDIVRYSFTNSMDPNA